MNINSLALKLSENHSLSVDEYEQLIAGFNDGNADTRERGHESVQLLRKHAVRVRREFYGNDVYIRGLIEISNICRNDCYYCGIRRSNSHCERYRLSHDEILACADEGYGLGFRTFVLQGGEDSYFSDERLGGIVRGIKSKYPDCAVTLSMGERSHDSYKFLRDCGADRYLLRHETANPEHYAKLHPAEMSYSHRMNCLHDLRELGYQVGCGFMVGSPFQTSRNLAEDLKFIEEFKPEMCGIGPFIPHKDTPFHDYPAGTLEMTCYLLSIIRLIHPSVLLPSTTALGTINPIGRELGIMAGANVVMPNLSPVSVRKKYELYDGKICTGEESAQCRECLNNRMRKIGYEIVTSRGDFKQFM